MKILILLLTNLILLFGWVGKIVALKNEVVVKRDGKLIKANIGFKLEKNDVVISKGNSKTQIIFKDETVITIGKNSSFKINDYAYGGSSKPKANFSFFKGAFREITGKIGKIAPKRFKIKTPTASIGIRGTQIVALISKIEKIACLEGKIVVITNLGSVEVDAGKITEILPKKPPLHPRVYKPEEIKLLLKAAGGEKIVAAPSQKTVTEKKSQKKPASKQSNQTIKNNNKLNTQKTAVSAKPQESKNSIPQKIKVENPINIKTIPVHLEENPEETINVNKEITKEEISTDVKNSVNEVKNNINTENEIHTIENVAKNSPNEAENSAENQETPPTDEENAVENQNSPNEAENSAENQETPPSDEENAVENQNIPSSSENYNTPPSSEENSGSEQANTTPPSPTPPPSVPTITNIHPSVSPNLATPPAIPNLPIIQPNSTTPVSLLKPPLTPVIKEKAALYQYDDSTYWGVWYSGDTINENTISQFFVAGDETPSEIIDNLVNQQASYDYSGDVKGIIDNGISKSFITNGIFNFHINFGNENPITGNIDFDGDMKHWNTEIYNSKINGNAISANLKAGINNQVNINNGVLTGNFYNSDASKIGGNFLIESNKDKIKGIFIGKKN